MTLKRRVVTLTTDGAGAATGTLGLGASYGLVKAVQWDSGADSSSDLTISSSLPATSSMAAKTHNIYARTSVDASAAGGIMNYVVPTEDTTYDFAGEVSAANAGEANGVVAHSPLTLTIANGGATETHIVAVYVEV